MEYLPDKDKLSRVHAVSQIFYNGRVWMPHRSWAEELRVQLISFPFASHDDLVDTTSQALIFMRDGWKVEYLDEIDDDDSHIYKKPRLTYWKALTNQS